MSDAPADRPLEEPAGPAPARAQITPSLELTVLARAGELSAAELTELALPVADPANFTVLSELAHGGMGRILSALDLRLGRLVAIKQLLVRTPELLARFEREIRVTAKLQHPAIVTVLEAGVWPGGDPFYVMPLVAGRSLDAAIARHHTWAERLTLLPNVIAAVEALGYAHERGVLHRDLKPSNVLVGDFGETVVIDWGLAKVLAEPSTEAPPLSPTAAAGPQTTETGAVMGTPAYMSPEQATGGVVDARSDVYSLGSLLYHLLSGAHPYEGESGRGLIAVLDGPPPPLRTRVENVPPDLLAIVDKAMARSPAERYPTARELAEDLRKFQTGQLVGAHAYSSAELLGRWVRQQRGPLSVALVAMVLLATGAVVSVRRIVDERAQTERHRARADAQRVSAEKLLEFMLTDLRDKLEGVGRLELIDAVVTRAIGYYADHPEVAGRDDALRQAHAHEGLAQVLAARGDLVGAQNEAELAGRLCEGLERANANDPLVLDRLISVLLTRGDLQVARGDRAGAFANYQRANELAAFPVIATGPNGPHLNGLSASALGRHFQEQGDFERATAEYRRALAFDEAALANAPDDTEAARAVLHDHEWLGNALHRSGNHAAALAEYRAMLRLAEQVVARDPANTVHQRGLSLAHERIGSTLHEQHDVVGALSERRAALAIDERLAALDPSNLDLQFDLTISREKLALLLADGQQADAALRAEREVLTAREALAARSPLNTRLTEGLFASHRALGELLGAAGDLPGALAQYQGAKAAALTLTSQAADNPQWQGRLAEAHCGLGRVFQAQRRFSEAIAAVQVCSTTWKALLATAPDNHDFKQRIGLAVSQLGDVFDDQGKPAQALEAYREALAITRLAADGSDDPVDAAQLSELEQLIRDHERPPKR